MLSIPVVRRRSRNNPQGRIDLPTGAEAWYRFNRDNRSSLPPLSFVSIHPAPEEPKEVSTTFSTVMRDRQCTVCLLDVVAGQEVVYYPCGHPVHQICHDDMVRRSPKFRNQCPSRCRV